MEDVWRNSGGPEVAPPVRGSQQFRGCCRSTSRASSSCTDRSRLDLTRQSLGRVGHCRNRCRERSLRASPCRKCPLIGHSPFGPLLAMSAGMATTRRMRHDMTATNSVAGGNVRVRRPTVDDVDSLVRPFGWLGRESIQQRFFSVRTNWSPLDTHDGRVRIPSEQSVAALAWLSTPGLSLVLLCSLLLILGVAALAGAESPASPSDASWARDVRRVDEALARGDRSGAEWVWHDAYAKALAAREWEGMLAVGDAYLRIADAAHGRKVGEMTAR